MRIWIQAPRLTHTLMIKRPEGEAQGYLSFCLAVDGAIKGDL